MRSFLRLALFALLLLPGSRVLAADAILKLTGLEKSVSFTAAEFAALPRTEQKVNDGPEKKERIYSGVKMADLLAQVGAPLGEKMRGSGMTTAVLVRCKDDYTVLFALAEFDEAFSSRTILLCDKENGEMLPPSAAPLRLVTPGDKRGARSARQVSSIELVAVAPKS